MPIYMEYDGIKGDVTEEGHKKWIELSSFQWGVGRGITSPTPGNATNREASAPSVSEITVSKMQDGSTAKLLRAALDGEGKKVTIDFVKTDKGKLETYLQFKLEEVMISGYSTSSGGDRPSESLSLNFTKIEYNISPNKKSGEADSTDRGNYNLETAVAG